MEQTVDEITRLQGCINGLISVLTLPALWSGHEPSQIVPTLLDVLVGMLRLDFAYVQLREASDGAPIELVRVAQRGPLAVQPQEVGHALHRWVREPGRLLHSRVERPQPPQGRSMRNPWASRVGKGDGRYIRGPSEYPE